MLTGTIKRYDFRKGFGFISEETEGEDYFFHRSEWKGNQPIRQGMRVNFDSKSSEKGTQAANVLPLESEGKVSGRKEVEKRSYKSAGASGPISSRDLESRLLAVEASVSTWKKITVATLLIVAGFIAYQFTA